jgi:hypothetical protein
MDARVKPAHDESELDAPGISRETKRPPVGGLSQQRE